MSNKNNHWHIAGLGAIGALCTATVLKAKGIATPIVRKDSQSFCRTFTDLSSAVIALPNPVEQAEVMLIDNLVVPLKSYDVVAFLSEVKDKLSANAQVILCHNGMGTIEPALDLLPTSSNLYFCTSSHGVFKKGRQAIYAGLGDSSWQLIRQGNNQLLSNAQINTVLPNAQQVDDLNLLLWQKLIINCAINPLTAIHQVKNGELAGAKFVPQIADIVKEAVTIANSCNINIEYDSMLARVQQVIELTAANTSSMLQDVQNQRITEIDFITGYLLQQAQQHKIDAPVNQLLLDKVKTLS